jgi:hypothetical protein
MPSQRFYSAQGAQTCKLIVNLMNVTDPMGFARDLHDVGDYYPLGFPLRLWSNSRLVQDAAASAWGAFPAAFPTPALEVHVLVEDGAANGTPLPPDYRGREHLFMIMGGHDSAVCDHARGYAFCRLSEATVRHGSFVAYYYLEAIAFHLLTQLYLTPVHAACLSKPRAGVLLCGDSGAGKTSLAYACARNGWCYVSDNESWLLRDHEGLAVLGTPHRIRFRDSAPELFPELSTREPFLFANGKMSLTMEMSGREEFRTDYRAEITHLVFLDRGRRKRIASISKDEALRRLLQGVPCYSKLVHQQHEASLRRLVGVETASLSYEALEDGIELLDQLVAAS